MVDLVQLVLIIGAAVVVAGAIVMLMFHD